MVRELIHDPFLLARKSVIATKEDLPIGQDLLEMPGFHALFLQDSITDPNIRKLNLPSEQMQHVCSLLKEMEQEYQSSTSGFQTALLCNFTLLLPAN